MITSSNLAKSDLNGKVAMAKMVVSLSGALPVPNGCPKTRCQAQIFDFGIQIWKFLQMVVGAGWRQRAGWVSVENLVWQLSGGGEQGNGGERECMGKLAKIFFLPLCGIWKC